LLNAHDKKLHVRNEQINKLRAAHMKEFQARYTKEQQIELQEEIRKRTERGDYLSIFSLMKEQANKMKLAMAAENARFMAMHGQVWDPKKDTDAASKTGIESMLDSLEFDSGSAGQGLAMIRPGDASKL
jgi:galactokinase/mevalonate kinase-like predicted kinase